MKKDQVQIGGHYYANVSGKSTEVRIDSDNSHGGWDATNVTTGKKVRIKTAARLYGVVGGAARKTKAKSKDATKEPTVTATDECPRGGKHQFAVVDRENACTFCGEPAPTTKAKKTDKLAIYVARPKGNAAKEAMDQVRKDTAERSAKAAAAEAKTHDETPAAPAAKKLSSIDAAAKVLAESGAPMSAKEMIDAMAAKGYWTSPGGKTPHATLYSAIIREISLKGEASRFRKTERGKFATA